MVFQEPMAALNPAVKVGAQIEEVFKLHSRLSARERRLRITALLSDTRLPDPERIAASYPHQLSGGQCQRVVIAMALALRPALLIADEPTSALDVTTQAQVLKLMRELRDEHGHAVLFITHDFGVVAEVADRVAVMQGGHIVEIGAYPRLARRAAPSLHPQADRGRAARRAAVDLERQAQRLAHRSRSPISPRSYRAGGQRIAALKDASFVLDKGRTLGVVGESGSGKSTLARVAIRLTPADRGSVRVGGVDLAKLGGKALARARRKMQMIFQDPYGSLNPRHSVGAIITRAGRLGGRSSAEARESAIELLRLVGLKPEAFARKPHEFSGGQRQRVGIARALAMNPEVVFADECVSALDVSVQKQVLRLIAELQARLDLTLVFITHDLRVAAQVSDYIAVMRQGEIVEFGEAEEVLKRPRHPYTRELIAAAPGRNWTPPVLEMVDIPEKTP